MIIKSSNIAYYLLEKGLVTFESVVDGDFLAIDNSRRNRNIRVIRKNHPSYFIKQIQQWVPDAITSLQREATCYWLAKSDNDFTSLAPLTPEYRFYDSNRHILIVDLLPDGENLTEYHQRLRAFPNDVAALVGKALGTYHRDAGLKIKDYPHPTIFPKQIPWILSVYQQGMHYPMGGANNQVVSIVRQYPDFQNVLDGLRREWTINSLMHGDMKWDNCIVYKETPDNEELKLKIVDWELADFGEAGWDVGAIFQSYLTFWIFSIPANENTPVQQLADRATYPIETMQPAIHTFWNHYVETKQVKPVEAKTLLEQCVKYAAARMIQTAFEAMFYSPQITPQVVLLLQASLNILTKPKEAIRELLAFNHD